MIDGVMCASQKGVSLMDLAFKRDHAKLAPFEITRSQTFQDELLKLDNKLGALDLLCIHPSVFECQYGPCVDSLF